MSQSTFARRMRKFRTVFLELSIEICLRSYEKILKRYQIVFLYTLWNLWNFYIFWRKIASVKSSSHTINMQELITIPNLPNSLATDTQMKLRSIVDDINNISKAVLSDNCDDAENANHDCQMWVFKLFDTTLVNTDLFNYITYVYVSSRS